MRTRTRILVGLACASAVAALPLAARFAVADPPATVAVSAATMPVTRGGVRYDPTLPLDAEVTPRFDAKNPPALALTYHVRYKGGGGESVPALLVVPAGAKAGSPVPCIVFQHGLGGRKEEVFLLSAAAAKRGYASFFMDAAYHGERVPKGGKTIADLNLPEFHTAVGQTIADLRRGVDFLATRPEIDGKRVAYVGASLGGILGGVFAADEPRVKAAVLWAAGGGWGNIISRSEHRFADRFRKGPNAATAEAIATELSDVDPLKTVGLIAPRPVLFINGDKDNVVPVSCANDLYAAAKDPKEREILPGGHVPDVSIMVRDTLNWLDKNVK
jgi:cephalosporin-C deacetylase-like acetyl esterase